MLVGIVPNNLLLKLILMLELLFGFKSRLNRTKLFYHMKRVGIKQSGLSKDSF